MASASQPAESDQLAQVLLFPRRKSCFLCAHARFEVDAAGEDTGTRCSVYGEQIDHENVAAASCPQYEYDPEKDASQTPRS